MGTEIAPIPARLHRLCFHLHPISFPSPQNFHGLDKFPLCSYKYHTQDFGNSFLFQDWLSDPASAICDIVKSGTTQQTMLSSWGNRTHLRITHLRSDDVLRQLLKGEAAEHLTADHFIICSIHQRTQRLDGRRQLVLRQYTAVTYIKSHPLPY